MYFFVLLQAITNENGSERQIPITKTNAPAIKQEQAKKK